MSEEGRVPVSQALDNFEIYKEHHRAKLEAEQHGRVALLHDGELVAVYDTIADAYAIGCEQYGLGSFSLQEIGAKPIQLGILTAALDSPSADDPR